MSLFSVFSADSLPDRIIHSSLLTGGAIRFVEFTLTLDRVLTYRNKQEQKPLVLAADTASSYTANRLVYLVQRTFFILSGLPAHPLKPISPHVTLAWDHLQLPEQPITPIALPVQEVALVHSHVGKSRYDILGRWKLTPQ